MNQFDIKPDEKQNKIMSFDEFCVGRSFHDNGGPEDSKLFAEAKKMYQALQNTQNIKRFFDMPVAEQHNLIKDLDKTMGDLRFMCAYHCALAYAEYVEANQAASLRRLLERATALTEESASRKTIDSRSIHGQIKIER